jgi:colicin import membrane protein
MESVMNSRIYLPVADRTVRPLFFAIIVSVVCHIIFFAMLLGLPQKPNAKIALPMVVNVDLVSLPGPSGPAPKKTVNKPVKKITASKKPTAPKIKKTRSFIKKPTTPTKVNIKPSIINIPPKPVVKTSLKKQTFKPEKVLKNVVAKIEKKVEEDSSKKIAEAIDRLKETVKKKNPVDEAISKIESKVANQRPGSGPGGTGRKGTSGQGEGTMLMVYQVEIADRISKNWVFSEHIAGGQTDIVALVVFRIMPDGEIRDVTFTQRSGNRYLDESAMRAIAKSNPTLPHPPGIERESIQMGVRFTPEGIL